MIVKVNNGYKIKSHSTGKMYPKVYATYKEALKQLRRMEYFKRLNKK